MELIRRGWPLLVERLRREEGVPELAAAEGEARADEDDGESRGSGKDLEVEGESSTAPPALDDETLSLRFLDP